MKMNNLFVGAILGLLVVVHSTPVNTVTEIPTKAEVDVLPETIMGELLDDYLLLPSLRVASPKKVTNTEASQQSPSNSKDTDVIEGNPAEKKVNSSNTSKFFQPSGDHHAIASHGVSQAQRPTSTTLPGDTEDSSLDSSASQSLQSASSVPNKVQSRVSPDHISSSQTTDQPVSGFDFHSTMSSDLGSGDGEMLGQYAVTSSAAPSVFREREISDLGSVIPGLPVIKFDFQNTLQSDSGSGDGELLGQHATTSSGMKSSSRPEISTAYLTSTAPPVFKGNEDSVSVSGMSRLGTARINLQSSELGSGDEEILDTTTSSREETSTELPTTTAPSVFRENQGSNSGTGMSGLSTAHPDFLSTLSSDILRSKNVTRLGHNHVTSSREETSTELPTTTAPSVFRESQGSNSGAGMSGLSTAHPDFLSTLNSDISRSKKGTRLGHNHVTSSREETSTELPTTTAPSVFRESQGSNSGTGMSGLSTAHPDFLSTLNSDVSRSKNGTRLGHNHVTRSREETSTTLPSSNSSFIQPRTDDQSVSTPGWMVIVAFIVGVAAVGIIGAAIFTRHKWRGPNHRSQLETKADSSNQQSELDMEALLNKDKPRENGKASEYTVIPLDDLQVYYSSH
ncbi:polycystic kidney disease protein 1-like 3 [Mastacembelus armatus]|uniref:polycystic kidney disease protein 1-like 3 n=1 Tax=Mastacembelus armatus TaxID=205130 RepID=UPI000E45CE3E|nr:polycystic kidney disease protein 1-like 3 [Mastacembelus armatus]